MDVVKDFKNLIIQGKNQEIIYLLSNYRKSNKLSINEQGWVFWNVSDCYALLGQPESLYKNHTEFFNWGNNYLSADKLHWIVTDSTQALSLSLVNYFDEWINWYNYACSNAPKLASNRGARFESHRALIGSLLVLDRFDEIDSALENLNQLIQEDESWINSLFSKITYYKLLLARLYKSKNVPQFVLILNELKDITESLKYTEFENSQEELVLGSWEQLNAPRNSQNAILVALNNLACTYTDIEQHQESTELFEFIEDRGHHFNSFGFSKYLLSTWLTRGNESAKNMLQNHSFELPELCKHTFELAGIEL